MGVREYPLKPSGKGTSDDKKGGISERDKGTWPALDLSASEKTSEKRSKSPKEQNREGLKNRPGSYKKKQIADLADRFALTAAGENHKSNGQVHRLATRALDACSVQNEDTAAEAMAVVLWATGPGGVAEEIVDEQIGKALEWDKPPSRPRAIAASVLTRSSRLQGVNLAPFVPPD